MRLLFAGYHPGTTRLTAPAILDRIKWNSKPPSTPLALGGGGDSYKFSIYFLRAMHELNIVLWAAVMLCCKEKSYKKVAKDVWHCMRERVSDVKANLADARYSYLHWTKQRIAKDWESTSNPFSLSNTCAVNNVPLYLYLYLWVLGPSWPCLGE